MLPKNEKLEENAATSFHDDENYVQSQRVLDGEISAEGGSERPTRRSIPGKNDSPGFVGKLTHLVALLTGK